MSATTTEHVENIGSSRIGLGFFEFVITIALMTASVAMAIDIMLPALPNIGQSLGVENANDSQWVIGVFMLGFGCSQIIFGSLSDAFGRRRVLLCGLAFYAICMFAAALSGSFEMLLVMRFIQGIGAGRRAHHHDGDRARLLRRPRNGTRHVLCHDRLHDHPDRRAVRRPGNHHLCQLALDLHPARHRRSGAVRLGLGPHARIAAGRRAPAAVGIGRSLRLRHGAGPTALPAAT